MKTKNILLMAIVSALLLSGCGGTTDQEERIVDVGGAAGFISSLEAEGAVVEELETIEQPFFSVVGQGILVNGQALQVFEYFDTEAAAAQAETISPDGGSVGTSMMMWMDAPHFFSKDNLIVLYVGSDAAVLDLLQIILGNQIAGQ